MSHYEVAQAEDIQIMVYNASCCLDGLRLAVSLARVDLLAGLLDLLQHGVVVEGGFGDDGCSLAVERDIERLDTWLEDCLPTRSRNLLLVFPETTTWVLAMVFKCQFETAIRPTLAKVTG